MSLSNHGLGDIATGILTDAANTVGKARETYGKEIKLAWSTLASAKIADADGNETDQYVLSWSQFVSPKKTSKNDNYLLSSVSQETYEEVKGIFVAGLSDWEKATMTKSAIARKAGSLMADAKDACLRVQDAELFRATGGVLSLIVKNEDGSFSKRILTETKAEADAKEAETGPVTPVASAPVAYTSTVASQFQGLINTLKAGVGDKAEADEQEVATDWQVAPVLAAVEEAYKLLQA